MESGAFAVLAIIYIVVVAIRTYDLRIIQSRMGRMDSAVAQDADGKVLPNWVDNIHILGWLLLIGLLVIDWKAALLLYGVLFVLRVMPVLETLGAVLAKPFLQDADADSPPITLSSRSEVMPRTTDNEGMSTTEELEDAKSELAVTKLEIEKQMFMIQPGAKEEDFVPPFDLWWGLSENQNMNLLDGLKVFIYRYGLLSPKYDDEPGSETLARASLSVLTECGLTFDNSGENDYRTFLMGLRQQIHHYEWKRERGLHGD